MYFKSLQKLLQQSITHQPKIPVLASTSPFNSVYHPYSQSRYYAIFKTSLVEHKASLPASCRSIAAPKSSRKPKPLPGEYALKFLFDHCPKFPKFEGDVGTRDPAQYDMHLHSELILKDIVLFPDMLDQLAGVVDSKLHHLSGNLPRVSRSANDLRVISGTVIPPYNTFHRRRSRLYSLALIDGQTSSDVIARAGLPDDLNSDIQLVIETGLSDSLMFWDFRRFCRKTDDIFNFQFAIMYKTGEDGGIFEDGSDIEFGVSNSGALRFDKSNINSVLSTSGRKFKIEGDDIGFEDDGGTNDDALSFNEDDFTNALKIIQNVSVWAEAVNVDATFMVLNTGSREFIGIRDRKLQRLYLSPLIDLDDPSSLPAGYFKIHADLQITALLDTLCTKVAELHVALNLPTQDAMHLAGSQRVYLALESLPTVFDLLHRFPTLLPLTAAPPTLPSTPLEDNPAVNEIFRDEGFINDTPPLKLHMTLVNNIYGRPRTRRPQLFKYDDILQ
ncbi:hypothetical protein EV421DRAFT_2033052 [Armillaria borealis]|uniref:Uncharacterized protein n=1 Tax=Armillaria borealis TaxID=47425 RepID=A0AA39JS92_9AGAR|nr:hypothetical protein EV421DRAFT_2033052 [Armillaria borealis]